MTPTSSVDLNEDYIMESKRVINAKCRNQEQVYDADLLEEEETKTDVSVQECVVTFDDLMAAETIDTGFPNKGNLVPVKRSVSEDTASYCADN